MFPIKKLAFFLKVKSKIPDFERGKSRNYAKACKWHVAQIIPQIDPREIGSAFHRASSEIVEKSHFWMETHYKPYQHFSSGKETL